MYIDSHAHLFYEDYRSELPEVLQRAEEAGIDYIVVPGTTLRTSEEAVGLADRYPQVYACVGYHPHEASNADDAALAGIETLSKHKKVVAIGEIGLDYHYDFSPRARQIEIFRHQVRMAIRRDLPVVVHTRNSMEEAIGIVNQYVEQHPGWKSRRGQMLRGVFHCFTGNVEEAQRLFELGFFLSFPGIVTFKNSPVVETLRRMSANRFLIETDSPYMSPVPFRGKRNEPANVVYVAEKIAEILQIDLKEVARISTENARLLFGID